MLTFSLFRTPAAPITASMSSGSPLRAAATLGRAALAASFLIGAGTAANAQSHKTNYSAKPAAASANSGSLVKVEGVTFVKWTEPKEGAFSVDVPQGWKVDGVLSRPAQTDFRTAIQVRSPEDNMTVVLGDPSLPMFVVPTQNDQMMGHGEGYADVFDGLFQRYFMHYMPAPEFNRWYVQKGLGSVIDGITMEGEKPLPELGQKLTAMANRGAVAGGPRTDVTVALTWFTGQVKATGKPIRGAILSTVRLIHSDKPGYIASWTAEPAIVGCENGANKEELSKTVLGVFLRMKQTFAPTPGWSVKEMQRVAKISADRQKRLAAQQPTGGGARPFHGGQGGGGGIVMAAPPRQDLMASYWRRNAQRAESQHQFINYIRDEKDVINPVTGERHTVSDKY